MPLDHRVTLNNYLQDIYHKQNVLVWEDKLMGPPSQEGWEALAIINGKEYGRGYALKLRDAREQAAHVALINHRSEREIYILTAKGPSGSSLHTEKPSSTRSTETPQVCARSSHP